MKKKIFGFAIATILCLSATSLIASRGNTNSKKFRQVFATGETHNHEGYTVWGDEDSEKTGLPSESGDYALTSDITLSETWTVPVGETNLCLNGHVINAFCTGENNFRVIAVNEGATLNLYDCDTTTSHNGYVDNTGLWHFDATDTHIRGVNETEKDIIGGIITGGNSGNGGGIYVNKGTFNMFGGTIAGNVGRNGGGVNINSAVYTMRGGNILGNTASVNSAGVHLSASSFEMTGGIITENVTNSNDVNTLTGGVYISSKMTNAIFGGSAKIINNSISNGVDDRYAANLGLYRDAIVSIGTGVGEGKNGVILPNDDMSIGVTMKENTGKFATGVTAKDIKYFSSDNENFEVLFNSGTEEIGDEYLELKEKATIADILPAHFPIRINSDMPENPWLNEKEAKLYLISNGTITKLQFDGQDISAGGFTIDIDLKLTANNGNYIYNYKNSFCDATITFNMLNGKLDSVNMINYSGSKESNALLNGTYDGILVHTLKETHSKEEATCTESGHEVYYECDCGAYLSNSALTEEIPNLEVWLAEGGGGYIAPLGHNFGGEVTYTWNEETHECTASHKCQRDGCTETQSELASIENGKVVYVKDFDATCTANEKGHYEATFTVQEFEKQATSMFDVQNTAKGHDYETPTYTWNEDYTKCTATATCSHGDSTVTNEGTITIEDGYAVATFEDDIFETQRVKLPEPAPKKSGLSGGAIAGIAIGSFVGLCLIAYIVMFFIWKKTEKTLKFLVPSYKWINKKIFKK